MSVLFTAAFAGISLVWDREFGFMREMLVAPISTTSILIGKALGGASVATMQSVVVLALAGLVGVPYDPLMMVELLLLLFLMAFMITALGLVLAARIKQIQSAMPMVQLIITPMMFLSGALLPAVGPAGLAQRGHPRQPDDLCGRADPPVVFDRLSVDAATRAVSIPAFCGAATRCRWSLQVGVVSPFRSVLFGWRSSCSRGRSRLTAWADAAETARIPCRTWLSG